ncbi:hypothetical protein EIP91_007412 [Steccherinum ochraceum]|uniref:Uncharacterized protein n=1 Tax=Steccherinum ochraceum TaxID=92696 RepID=A0A4R0RQP1_9APHY|nr:hypothetical protein EIP91_007412 [Steccherinum ochraceum]
MSVGSSSGSDAGLPSPYLHFLVALTTASTVTRHLAPAAIYLSSSLTGTFSGSSQVRKGQTYAADAQHTAASSV